MTTTATKIAYLAREAGWTHEQHLAAVLSQEVASREASGASIRIRAAGFGNVKSLEDFDHQVDPRRDVIAHLATGNYLLDARNATLLEPPGTGRTHLAIGQASRPRLPATAYCSRPR